MKKSDLKTGMQFEKNGERFVVLLGTKKGDVYVKVGGEKWGYLDYFRKDLTHKTRNETIDKVFENSHPDQYLIREFDEYALISERQETPEYVEIIEHDDFYKEYGVEKGNVLKVERIDCLGDMWVIGTRNSSACLPKHFFKPSTKDAYDKQNAIPSIEEAERRGFVNGAKFYGVQDIEKDILIEIGEEREVSRNDLGLYCGNSYIYFKGKWAEVYSKAVPEKTMQELIDEIGYEFKIKK